jgi:hypothetical protein
MITAGIHGNEVGSIAAATSLIHRLQRGQLRFDTGTLVIIPIVNQSAYGLRIRGLPDLNRTFPKAKGQSARHPLSAAIIRVASRYRPTWVLDLHEANGFSNVRRRYLGQSLITNHGSASATLSRKIIHKLNRDISSKKRKFNLHLRHLPGSARFAAVKLFKAKAVTVETSWELPLSLRKAYQTKIVHHFLDHIGINLHDVHARKDALV